MSAVKQSTSAPQAGAQTTSEPVTIHGGNRYNIVSSWLFLWVFKLLRLSRRRNLNTEDLALQETEKAGNAGDMLERAWNVARMREERKHGAGSKKSKMLIRTALLKTFGASYISLGLYKLLASVFIFVGSYYVMNRLLLYLERNDASDKQNEVTGQIYAAALFVSALLSSVCINQLVAECTRIGVQVRAALMVLIYRKSLRLTSSPGGIGDVVNLLSNDCNRVAEAFVNFHFLWGSVLEIAAVIVFAWVELEEAAIPALIILLVVFPLQLKLGWTTSTIANSLTQTTSSRIQLMSEVLTAIKLIKFYAWEQYFLERAAEERRRECRKMLHSLGVKVWTYGVVFVTPVLVMLACMCVLLLAKSPPDGVKASTVFTVLTLFNTLRYPLIMLPIAVRTTLVAYASFVNLDEFLQQPELEPPSTEDEPIQSDPKLRIFIENADFSYHSDLEPTLRFLTMKVSQGEVVAIVGDVGAGKSSVLAAILGQIRIRKDAGSKRFVRGSMAYVPDDAWLLNATLMDNILFGHPYNAKRYQEVIHVCALKKDLEWLSNGDQTEIGDRGVNLSAGQRQRVSLARAVYSNADIILLDDPLSVMDPTIGKHIFHECIQKYLKNKAVVFVTNQLQFLPECDHILVMKDGTIEEEGTYEELTQKDFNLAALIGDCMEIEDPDQIDDLFNEIRLDPISSDEPVEGYADETKDLETIVVSGVRSTPPASNHNTVQFGSPSNMPSTIDANEHTISRIIDLNAHTIQNQNINEQTITRIIERNNQTVLSGAGRPRLVGSQQRQMMERNQLTIHSVSGGIGSMMDPESKALRRESEVSFWSYIDYLRKATGFGITMCVILSFFAVHAIRIVSDWLLGKMVGVTEDSEYARILGVYGAFVGVFGLAVCIRGIALALVMIRKSAYLHDRTLMRILRAPMSYFDVTPLSKILIVFAKHQYCVDDVFSDNMLQFLSFLPLVIGVAIFVMVLIPWTVIVAAVLTFCVWALMHLSRGVEERFKSLEANSRAPIFAHLSVSLEGLPSIRCYNVQSRFDKHNIQKIDTNNKALFAMMQVKAWLSFYIDVLASIFVYVTALFVVTLHNEDTTVAGLAISNALQLLVFVQWMVRSGRDVKDSMASVQQLLYYRNNIPSEGAAVIESNRPPPDWGQGGEIEFKHVILRYNRYGVAVLKNVSFHIRQREKIGIVGKTGSGKSTLLVSLLRIVELAEGQILIDGLDISTMGLRDLRNKIAVIPQEPVIFAGTIRSNLDPFDKCTDEEIWDALTAVHLLDKVRSMPQRLRTPVPANGKNFSLGQRQLFCIARALLKKSNILVLDEATSAVDLQTDVLIQETIKKNFAKHTVLTIAHRLNTIMECDRILCLNEGRLVEFDAPLRLLDKLDGFFYQLVTRSGSGVAERLRQIGLQHAPHFYPHRLDSNGVATASEGAAASSSRSQRTASDAGSATPPASPSVPPDMPQALATVFRPR